MNYKYFITCLAILILFQYTQGQVTINIPITNDNTIYSHQTSRSNGTGPLLLVGKNSSGDQKRGLIYFDIAGNVPSGSSIISAELHLDLDRYASMEYGGGLNPVSISMHRLTNDWGESTSYAGTSGNQRNGNGANAAEDDATWDARFFKPSAPGTSPMWGNPGGDFESSASATSLIDHTLGPKIWSGLAGDVQNMLDNPGNNFGWILIDNETANATVRKFDSKEGATPPFLVIEYLGSFPVVLSSFTGVINAQQRIELNWETETEENHSFFSVEKSTDGIFFSEVGKVFSAGNSNTTKSYSFLDIEPKFGTNFYRLRMVDLDASFEYSPTIEVRFEQSEPAIISVYPNPVEKNSSLTIELIESRIDDQGKLKIFDRLGRTILMSKPFLEEGKNVILLDTESLLPGIYTLSYGSTSLKFFTKIVVK